MASLALTATLVLATTLPAGCTATSPASVQPGALDTPAAPDDGGSAAFSAPQGQQASAPGSATASVSGADAASEASAGTGGEAIFPGASAGATPALAAGTGAEPPLEGEAAGMPAPDFLDAAQQKLYRQALAVSVFLYNGNANPDAAFPPPDDASLPESPGTVQVDGLTYTYAFGRYKHYADFEAMLQAVFTPEYVANVLGGNPPVFLNRDGRLAVLALENAQSAFPSGTPSGFELVQRTDDEILFYVQFSIEAPESEDGGASGNAYTLSCPVQLCHTENGWRVAQLSVSG